MLNVQTAQAPSIIHQPPAFVQDDLGFSHLFGILVDAEKIMV
jgi:hypothetical protein